MSILRGLRGLLVCLAISACGRSPSSTTDAPAATDAPPDGVVIHVDDGTPTRQACTSAFGNGLTMTYGRMDGYLVAVVPPGGGACNADGNHIHLQVKISGEIYDVAVDVDSQPVEDVHSATRDIPLPGLPWNEGWHPGGALDYVSYGVHSADLPLGTKAGLVSEMMTELATVNHISVFATGYGPDGAHLVHRNPSNRDGLIVTEPLSTPAHARFLSFTSQTF